MALNQILLLNYLLTYFPETCSHIERMAVVTIHKYMQV